MENDSKSGLCLRQIITIIMILTICSTSIQLLNNNKQDKKMADTKTEEIIENTKQEVQIADMQEREIKSTTRAAEERIMVVEIEEAEQVKEIGQIKQNYKTIEEITISKDMDLTQRCGISKEDFKTLMTNLKTDSSGFFKDNSDIIYDLCEEYELNEIFFCGLIAAESGWNIASSHRKANNYISMMSNGKLICYASSQEGLEAAAKLLHNKYLTKGGSCYYGKTLSSVQKRFCPNSSTWVNLVYGCMKQVIK